MNNIILVGKDKKIIQNYLNGYRESHHVAQNGIIEFNPESGQLTMAEVRKLLELTSRSFAKRTVFVVWEFGTAKDLVQNIFLKTLEEHQDNLGFILVAGSAGGILPTILSRCQIIRVPEPPRPPEARSKAEMDETVRLLKTRQTLASSVLRFKKGEKKEAALYFLDSFIGYGYFALLERPDDRWLAERLRRALEARNLIENNTLDPELTVDQVFLD